MKPLCKLISISVLLTAFLIAARGQSRPFSERMASTVMTLWQDYPGAESGRPARWSYEQAVVLKGMERVWRDTGDGNYFKYIQRSIDQFVSDDGTIKTYRLDDYNLDNILNGRVLLLLYKVTAKEKYLKTATLLRDQLKTQPRTSDGGFWHKKIYPFQMWLDGLYMGEPFYAEYAATFHEDAAFNDIAEQFIRMEAHARDPKTGLLYHGWDESKQQRWANKQTGLSTEFWARAIGWYAMALVDTLDYFPENHPRRAELIAILKRLAPAIEKYQDRDTGLWYQVLDKQTEKGNYFEASAACMFVYALAKGVRRGYLPDHYLPVAQKGYQGILNRFVKTDANGQVNLEGTVGGAGLGGNPYRDGSYQYYIGEKVVTNDPKGIGAFLMASSEIEMNANRALGKGKTVMLDYFFNAETKKDITGRVVPWHYKWEERSNGGYSLWGRVFRSFGVNTKSLAEAPSAADRNPIFKFAKRLYLKEISTFALTPPAKSVFDDKGDVIMAVAKVGRGTVFAVGDPWFYNEYLDGRKLPSTFDNYQAARDLTRWLITQSPAKK